MSQTDTQKQTKALEDIRALLQAILKRLDTLERRDYFRNERR